MGELRYRKPGPHDVVELSKDAKTGVTHLTWICPGCTRHPYHMVPVRRQGEPELTKPTWTWNGSLTEPTLSPSIRHVGIDGAGGDCHYFVKAGKLEFCGDSFHELKGKTVDMTKVNDE